MEVSELQKVSGDGTPWYYDQQFSRIEDHINQCRFLIEHSNCDGCEKLNRCRGEWDYVCNCFEDKKVPQEEVQPIISRLASVLSK